MPNQRPYRGRGGRGNGSPWRNNYDSVSRPNLNSGSIRQPDDHLLVLHPERDRNLVGRGRGRGRGALKTPALSRMELMASVSRSSGLERDGDDLKNFKIQQEYREFVQEKLDGFSSEFRLEIRSDDKRRIDAQENLLILFRKLREGIFSAKRCDEFALEVYETSFYLAIIFNSSKQAVAVMNHLVPGIYQSVDSAKPLCYPTAILSLLYHLVASYPSQKAYYEHLRSIPITLLPRSSNAYGWVSSLASALRSRNYSKFSQLYKKQAMLWIFGDTDKETLGLDSLSIWQIPSSKQLAKTAILVVLDDLRGKARNTSWAVLRSAYREVSCNPNTNSTAAWLSRSLSLQPLLNTDDRTWTAEDWLDQQATQGHTRKKDGVEGSWVVCKIR